MEATDRRVTGVRRVRYATKVDLCGRKPGLPLFEAQSVELSGRGMQVLSQIVPDAGTPVVLRFEHGGTEAILEGEVAWTHSQEGAGSFGIKFTALDAGSVSVLRELCGQDAVITDGTSTMTAPKPGAPNTEVVKNEPVVAHDPTARPANKARRKPEHALKRRFMGTKEPSRSAPQASAPELNVAEPRPTVASKPQKPRVQASSVKLHIDGLPSPMKAKVVSSKSSSVHVGSELAYFTVGKPLRVEDPDGGAAHDAAIDAVRVQVDPKTQVPQLVVSLRYADAGEDRTPQPSVVSLDEDETIEQITRRAREHGNPLPSRVNSELDDFTEDTRTYFDEEQGELAAAEEVLRSKAKGFAESAGGAAKSTSIRFKRVADLFFSKVSGARVETGESPPARKKPRRTSPAPRRSSATGNRVTRSSSQTRLRKQSVPASSKESRVSKKGLAVAAVVVVALGSGSYLFAGGGSPQFEEERAQAAVESLNPEPTVAEFPPPATLTQAQQRGAESSGIVAKVPLFGSVQVVEPKTDPKVQAPGAVDAISLSKDQSFSDRPAPPVKSQSSAKVFQVGRMNLPVIYRLRLDGPGEVVQGQRTKNGFSVFIPGRKVMETGAAISQRDQRIKDVRVSNTPAGSKVVVRFREAVSGYKARLRKDFVEFFINSPD